MRRYFFSWTNSILNASVLLAKPDAYQKKFHSEYGLKNLDELIDTFGHIPEWNILDDDSNEKYSNWRSASFLYLYTDSLSWSPPVCMGDNGKYIPSYELPISYVEREGLYFWKRDYEAYEHIWMRSGELEIPVYKQLADAKSELSQEGRDLCSTIEEATKIPTYYYLMRYWGRRNNESERLCPLCGKDWRNKDRQTDNKEFWSFHFQCYDCRLVSHEADSYEDERHARIGEYKRNKTEQKH